MDIYALTPTEIQIELDVTDHADGTQTVKAYYPQMPDGEQGFMRLLLSYD